MMIVKPRLSSRRGNSEITYSSVNASVSENDGAESLIDKVRHLQKEGEPLWRKDIQYDFLCATFDNEQKVFNNSYDLAQTEKHTFVNAYIDTMARKSKTSKVLRRQLLSGQEATKSTAIVCLLVNVGSYGYHLDYASPASYLPYHPSLQAYQDGTYKQLQGDPHLENILNGASNERPEPHSLHNFKALDLPRTVPVNLVSLICH
ncbi:hypothetical protein PG994_004262 [Apiospora phragmitis]|uniref:Uncharacterized protein n=1 Tax=Apiospora phragmitis TaxID=2905665 RepID=A0ABR1VQ36_9PEZI